MRVSTLHFKINGDETFFRQLAELVFPTLNISFECVFHDAINPFLLARIILKSRYDIRKYENMSKPENLTLGKLSNIGKIPRNSKELRTAIAQGETRILPT